MRLTKKNIKLFRIGCTVLVFISILVIIFVDKKIGAPLLALSLFFLFTPYKVGDKVK